MTTAATATAAEVLWTAHAARLLGYARKLVRGDVDLAEDLRSETIFRAIRALRQIDGFRGEAAPFTWLCSILRNLNLDRLRQAKLRWRATAPLGAIDPIDPRAADPAATVAAREEAALVRAAVADLTPSRRRLVDLVYLKGRTFDEACVEMGIARGTASSVSYTARQRLRAALESTAWEGRPLRATSRKNCPS